MRKKLKKKTDRLNKIISTQDKSPERKMSITLLENPPLTDKDKNNTEEKVDEDIIERTESEENLVNAKKETENLRKKLKEKKEQLESNKIKDEAELVLINKNLKDKSEKLENVSNTTKLLLNQLNTLNNQINEGYNKVKIYQAANKIKLNYLNELKIKDKKKVDQGKKIILINNKIIDKFKIHKEKLEKIIEEDKNMIINDLQKKLEKLNINENSIKNEINNLRLMKMTHEKKCILINEDLNKTLEIIKNEYNDEYKSKSNKINNNNLQFKRKETYSNSSIKSLPKIINSNNLTIQTNDIKPQIENNASSNNSKLISRNHKSLSNLFGEDYIIQKDLKELKDNIRNNIKNNINGKLKRYTNYSERKKINIKENNVKKVLFSKLEKDMLSKIIPKECIKKYQDKFKTIEDERIQIKDKLKMNEVKKKLNEEKSQLIFITEKKDNNLIKKNIELNSKISIIKRKMNIIIKDIKIIQKGLNNINEKYNNKKEENDKLKNYWTELKDDIKNKKISVKKGENISKNELDFLNNWGNNVLISLNKNKINNEETCDNNIPKKNIKKEKYFINEK